MSDVDQLRAHLEELGREVRELRAYVESRACAEHDSEARKARAYAELPKLRADTERAIARLRELAG